MPERPFLGLKGLFLGLSPERALFRSARALSRSFRCNVLSLKRYGIQFSSHGKGEVKTRLI